MVIVKGIITVVFALGMLIPSLLLMFSGMSAFAEAESIMQQIFGMLCFIAAGVCVIPSVALLAVSYLALILGLVAADADKQTQIIRSAVASTASSTTAIAEHTRAQRILLQQMAPKKKQATKPPVRSHPPTSR